MNGYNGMHAHQCRHMISNNINQYTAPFIAAQQQACICIGIHHSCAKLLQLSYTACLICWVLHSQVCNMHGTWIIVHVLKSLQMDLDRLHDVLHKRQKVVQSLQQTTHACQPLYVCLGIWVRKLDTATAWHQQSQVCTHIHRDTHTDLLGQMTLLLATQFQHHDCEV